ncbi:TIGR02680 family protein [Trichloromonas sp.]|uniref:TIGR02680 family protein n=1 Tax=Trichloromonas sp. TaxID=3069249 RepID=UPI002A4A810E|nr:TIGR02680 family protein [Trichloromonas sp.]
MQTTDIPLHLPRPSRKRWQPLRAGLTDLFFYDQEEFRFRDGRLLLRGNNGTGKSKVLALCLPFLFDGQTSPARVEPDGDPGKRMEWNLLLGGRYPERLGYTWLEFGRLTEDGGAEYFTIGCGLRAVAGRGAPTTWFFTTPLRLGTDFYLVGEGGFALNRERLEEVLGDHAVFENSGRYRRAVDEKLFQLGEERYRALVDLLIQLRQPQLSKRPNEKALSAALTEALPPFDRTVLTDVAEAFRNLEDERQELAGLAEAGRAVDEFRRHYRGYARILARRKARDVRQGQSRFEKTGGELNTARESLREAEKRRGELEAGIEGVERGLAAVQVEERILRDSPEMRSAEALRQAESLAAEKAEMADEARRAARHDGELSDRAVSRLEELEEKIASGRREVDETAACLQRLAAAVGFRTAHDALVAPLVLPDGPPDAEDDAAPLAEARCRAEDLCRRRREGIEHLETLHRELHRVRDKLAEAQRIFATIAAEGERLRDEQAAADFDVRTTGESLVGEFFRYLADLRELRLDEEEAVGAELREWTRTLAGSNPAFSAVESAFRNSANRLAEARQKAQAEMEEVESALREVEVEIRRLEGGETTRPPLWPARDGLGRLDRPGAALWQLVDFSPELAPEARAGIEAALESSGLLDAWITPEGKVLGPDLLDAVLTAAAPVSPSLVEVLLPAVDRDDPRAALVHTETVSAILAGIGWGPGDHPCWIAADGQWRLGPLQGCWRKEKAEYVGAGAREAARRRRLEELTCQAAVFRNELAEAERRQECVEERWQRLEREHRSLPVDTALREAHQRLVWIGKQLADQQERLTQAEKERDRRREEADEVAANRNRAAADLQLPTDEEELSRVAAALQDYREQLKGFWPELRSHRRSLAQGHAARRELILAREREEETMQRVRESETAARDAEVRLETLRSTVGESVAELERRLAANAARGQILRQEEKKARAEEKEISVRVGEFSSQVQTLTAVLERLDGERRVAVRHFQAFAEAGLLAAAVPELELPGREGDWSIDPALRLARRVEQLLEEVEDDEAAWSRFQRGIQEQLSRLQGTLSRYGHEAAGELTDQGFVVTIVFQGRRLAPDALAEGLGSELEERRRLLNERERELLENHLISEVASHLHTLIRDAMEQLGRMNAELEARPTSTGMKLRFQWKPLADGESLDAPVGLAEARKRLLRQVVDAWSPEDREAVGRFLQEHINRIRLADEGGTLLAHLERALDYRRWHRFTVERWQDGQWRSASGPASGGERVLAVTIPLFAAASAHYGSAAPSAPRLVLLDEAFAGVDDDSRAKCMGLLTQFDLDFIMTSEREWGCYPEVPGLSILQLTRREGIDAVHLSRWQWDGRRRERAADLLPPMQAPAAETSDSNVSGTGSLF